MGCLTGKQGHHNELEHQILILSNSQVTKAQVGLPDMSLGCFYHG